MMAVLSKQDRLTQAAHPIVQPTNLSAPIKGWNTRDALDAMDPLDAILLDNFFPDGGGVMVRNGSAVFANNVGPGAVRTLAEFNAGATRKFIAACSGRLVDISAGGDSGFGSGFSSGFSSGFGASSGVYTNDDWQWANFLSRLFFVNGSDTMQVYDGATFADGTFTGVTLSSLVGVQVYQQRLFFWQNNSTGFWFAPLNSITGALAFYDLAAFAPLGGNLIAAVTMSQDGGDGVQDFIVFILSSGTCLIYFGNDPSNANAWQLVGRYRISPPVNIRAVCNYGAEAFLTTFDDHIPLHQQLVALKLGQLPPRSKASGAVQAAVVANGAAFGWQALYYPRGRRLIFNVPNNDGTFDQHVQNTASDDQPWCRFKGMNAFCWGLYRDRLYFGGADGIVYLADTGNLDGTSAVEAVGQQAWNTLKSPYRKQVTAVRPLVQVFDSSAYNFGIGFDYGEINIPITAVTSGTGSPWDTSPWDTSPWATENAVNAKWSASGGNGTAIGLKLTVAATQAVTWLRTDFIYQPGNSL